MRTVNKLVARGLGSLPPGKHEDGAGLRFVKDKSGGSRWVMRITAHGRRREMGLGSYPSVTLAEARRLAENARVSVREGKDPVAERERLLREAARHLNLLSDVAKDAFESRKAELKGDGKAGRWFSPLELHILPKLGKTPVSEIDQVAIRDAVKPIWHSKAETARKAMNRLGIVLDHAAALGLDVDLLAVKKAQKLLGKSRHKAKHIPAMPWRDVPGFYQSLAESSVASNLALRLLILTGVRSTPLRFIREDQIAGDVWTIPGEAMKGRKDATADFRVPLVPEALTVIEAAKKYWARDGYLFPSVRKGVISDATMSRYMERQGLDARPHGFRSSLRDWLAEATSATHEVAETVLGHTVDGAVVRAYRRTDFIDQRRALLGQWADFVTGKAAAKPAAEIVDLQAARK